MIPGDQLLAHAESSHQCSECLSQSVPKSQPMHASLTVKQQGYCGACSIWDCGS